MDSPVYGGYRASTHAEAALPFNYVQGDPARTLCQTDAHILLNSEQYAGFPQRNRIKGFVCFHSSGGQGTVNRKKKKAVASCYGLP